MKSPWAREDPIIHLPDHTRRETIMQAAREATKRTWWWLSPAEIEKIAEIVVQAYEKR